MILSPPSCCNVPNAVLCSHPHNPPCALIRMIPAQIKEMVYNSILYALTFSVNLENRKKCKVNKHFKLVRKKFKMLKEKTERKELQDK